MYCDGGGCLAKEKGACVGGVRYAFCLIPAGRVCMDVVGVTFPRKGLYGRHGSYGRGLSLSSWLKGLGVLVCCDGKASPYAIAGFR